MTTAASATPRVSIPLRHLAIAVLAMVAIAVHLILRWGVATERVVEGLPVRDLPLLLALGLGGLALIGELLRAIWQRRFGADLLAGIAMVTAWLLGEYLAGTLVVLMLSGGEAIEALAVRGASSALAALARRMPAVAHLRRDGHLEDVELDVVEVGDLVVVLPHEICPVDGTVVEGHSTMDEAYLTGEPYVSSKVPGSDVLSGAVNGESALTLRAVRRAVDSRYSKIMQVMRESEARRPRLRRLGDQLGAIYTPVAVAVAVVAWIVSGDPVRFLAVLVVATPCPLLIAIPVAIIGSISLAARRGIVIRDPVTLERLGGCRTAIFDKTGTLTYGRPEVTEVLPAAGTDPAHVVRLAASIERYSKHPLSLAIQSHAERERLAPAEAVEIAERPGEGLEGLVEGFRVRITGRSRLLAQRPELAAELPPPADGLECVVLIDDRYAATIRLRDEPRHDGPTFVSHLRPRHRLERVLLVSGDRESEVRYLAEHVGIDEVFANQSPEQKLALVRAETARAPTVFMGDGINDAPAMTAATVGIAFGQTSDVTTEAAGAVILGSSLQKVDELLHISLRMRRIALQSAVGGMIASVAGMFFAAAGYLPPVAGALVQEAIDVVAVANALRVALPPRSLSDY